MPSTRRSSIKDRSSSSERSIRIRNSDPPSFNQAKILLSNPFGLDPDCINLAQDLFQGDQMEGRDSPFGNKPFRPVGQGFHPVHDPHHQIFSTNRAEIILLPGLFRGITDPATPMTVKMIFAFFREKFNGGQKTFRVFVLDGLNNIRHRTSAQSKILASRPILAGEWASELEIRLSRSRADQRQFMAGSEERPVSMA